MSHYTRHRTAGRRLGDLTIGMYAPVLPTLGMYKWGSLNSNTAAAKAHAIKRGWTIRTDPRGWMKVMDPKTGNVAFSQRQAPAVWGLIRSLEYCREYSEAWLAIRRDNIAAIAEERTAIREAAITGEEME